MSLSEDLISHFSCETDVRLGKYNKLRGSALLLRCTLTKKCNGEMQTPR